eukprot:UN02824
MTSTRFHESESVSVQSSPEVMKALALEDNYESCWDKDYSDNNDKSLKALTSAYAQKKNTPIFSPRMVDRSDLALNYELMPEDFDPETGMKNLANYFAKAKIDCKKQTEGLGYQGEFMQETARCSFKLEFVTIANSKHKEKQQRLPKWFFRDDD